MEFDPFKSQADYQVPILRILAHSPSGKATAAQTKKALESLYGDRIPDEHRQPLSSNPKVNKWETYAAFARVALIRRGLMDGSEHGLWVITQEGRQWVALHADSERIEPGSAPPPKRTKRRKRGANSGKRQAYTAPLGSLTETVTFQLNGRVYQLTGEDVLSRVRTAVAAGAPAAADDYRTWALEVDGRRVNLKWVIELIVDQPRSSFDTPIARNILRRLGIEATPVRARRSDRTQRAPQVNAGTSLDGSDQAERYVTLDHEVAVIRQFVNGRADRPSDEKLCDWVHFCYMFGLYPEAGRLFAVVDPSQVNPWHYERTKRLARICAMRAKN